MLIDRLQSLIAVLITFIGVLLANSAPELHSSTNWSNEMHRYSNNKSLNKNSQDWLGGEELLLEEEVAGHYWLSRSKTLKYLDLAGGQEDCCPSQMEMIEPNGGSNPDGLYVELYSDGADKQRFYEVSCKPGVEGKPCLFMERKLHDQSTCVQRYSYSYAMVRDESVNVRHHNHHHSGGVSGDQYDGDGGGGKQAFKPFSSFNDKNKNLKLEYIKVRSGCACMVTSTKKKQQKQKRRNGAGGGGGGKRSQQ